MLLSGQHKQRRIRPDVPRLSEERRTNGSSTRTKGSSWEWRFRLSAFRNEEAPSVAFRFAHLASQTLKTYTLVVFEKANLYWLCSFPLHLQSFSLMKVSDNPVYQLYFYPQVKIESSVATSSTTTGIPKAAAARPGWTGTRRHSFWPSGTRSWKKRKTKTPCWSSTLPNCTSNSSNPSAKKATQAPWTKPSSPWPWFNWQKKMDTRLGSP